MCNLYRIASGPAEIGALTRSLFSGVGNLEPRDIYPDYTAPIVRLNADGEPILTTARWGMPSPEFALKGKNSDKGITNVRNTSSPHWRRWLGPANRCLVPFNAFSEPDQDYRGSKKPIWFALSEDQPLAFFAGVHTQAWTGIRKVKTGPETIDLAAFLTTESAEPVKTYHSKAMPVILTTEKEMDLWLHGSWEDARALQRPLPDGLLTILDAAPGPAAQGQLL